MTSKREGTAGIRPLPTQIVPTCCLAALVIDGTHIEWAHEARCDEGRDHV